MYAQVYKFGNNFAKRLWNRPFIYEGHQTGWAVSTIVTLSISPLRNVTTRDFQRFCSHFLLSNTVSTS